MFLRYEFVSRAAATPGRPLTLADIVARVAGRRLRARTRSAQGRGRRAPMGSRAAAASVASGAGLFAAGYVPRSSEFECVANAEAKLGRHRATTPAGPSRGDLFATLECDASCALAGPIRPQTSARAPARHACYVDLDVQGPSPMWSGRARRVSGGAARGLGGRVGCAW